MKKAEKISLRNEIVYNLILRNTVKTYVYEIIFIHE